MGKPIPHSQPPPPPVSMAAPPPNKLQPIPSSGGTRNELTSVASNTATPYVRPAQLAPLEHVKSDVLSFTPPPPSPPVKHAPLPALQSIPSKPEVNTATTITTTATTASNANINTNTNNNTATKSSSLSSLEVPATLSPISTVTPLSSSTSATAKSPMTTSINMSELDSPITRWKNTNNVDKLSSHDNDHVLVDSDLLEEPISVNEGPSKADKFYEKLYEERMNTSPPKAFALATDLRASFSFNPSESTFKGSQPQDEEGLEDDIVFAEEDRGADRKAAVIPALKLAELGKYKN